MLVRCISVAGVSHPRMQSNIGTFRGSQVYLGCNALDCQCCFFSQARCDRELAWIALAPHCQFRLAPTKPIKFFGQNPIRSPLGRLQAQLTSVVLAQFAFDLLEQLLPKLPTAQAPTPSKNLQ